MTRPGQLPPRAEAAPPRWSEVEQVWILTRYADVQALLRAQQVEAVPFYTGIAAIGRRAGRDYGSLVRLLAGILMFRNPPGHGIAREWLRRGLATLAPRFAEATVLGCIATALAPLRPGAPVELVGALANRIPVLVMAQALGLGEATVATLYAHGRGVVNAWERGMKLRAYDALQEQSALIEAVLREELARARREGGPLTALLAPEHESLDEDALVGGVFNIIMAGIETTAGLLSSAMLFAFAVPEQAAALRCGELPLRGFVEEVLRCAPPLRRLPGRRLLAAQRFSDVEIPAGAILVADVEAAQHDPAIHAEPDRFDPTRRRAPLLAFGAGVHACLGVPLASLEARLLLQALLPLDLALLPEPPLWEEHPSFRRLSRLRARLETPLPERTLHVG